MEDYYALLGLDPGSSEDSIKLAYRRLAREAHPDLNMHLSPAEQAEAATRMATLNRAYAVLSDARQKRAYDEEIKTLNMVSGITSSNGSGRKRSESGVGVAVSDDKTPPRGNKTPSGRVRPGSEVSTSVVSEFSSQLRQQLESNKKLFTWKPVSFEGFHWALEASSWPTQYCVALRNFATVNVDAVRKFGNYANLAVDQSASSVRKNYFVFILAFQRLLDAERVSIECRQIIENLSKRAVFGLHPYLALLDTEHGRSLVWGKKTQNKHFTAILNTLRIRES